MPAEIERRFLVRSDAWCPLVQSSILIHQAYLASGKVTVRLRLTAPVQAGTSLGAEPLWMAAFLTLKGPKNGATCPEFEYSVPVAHALEMLTAMPLLGCIRKVRHRIPQAGLVWEVDEFQSPRPGLIIAEIELPAEDTPLPPAPWLDEEITTRRDLSNAAIAAIALAGAEGAPAARLETEKG